MTIVGRGWSWEKKTPEMGSTERERERERERGERERERERVMKVVKERFLIEISKEMKEKKI